MSRTYPDGFDEHDRAFLDDLIPDDTFVQEMVTVVTWMTADGQFQWRCYCQGGDRVIPALGLLEIAKLDIIARSDTGLPIRYPDDEDDTP